VALPAVTRAESAERSRLLHVESYDIALDLTRGTQQFGSVCVIRFGCGEPGAASHADLDAETVREITLNGVVLDPGEVWSDGRIALTGLAGQNELRVAADFTYSNDGSALYRTTDFADGRVYCSTMLYPVNARRVFACFDQQDLKATFTMHITAPAHWTVLSNQLAPDPEPGGPGTAVWHFAPTPPVCTFSVALAAGEYQVVRAEHMTPRGQPVQLGVGCRQSLADSLDADEILAITRQGLDYYTALFDMDLPFVKHDQVFVPDFNAGACEQPGCVMVNEQFLFRARVTDYMYETRAMVILHELAHYWFGELVTDTWWDGIWLNESFAELCGIQASAEATRYTGAWTSFSGRLKQWAYFQDQLPSTHPIAPRADTLAEAIGNFDGISYAKGAAVLRQLVAYVGREEFFAGIRSYFAEHAWGNATLADFLQALTNSSGRDLTAWSKAWLESAGPNSLRGTFDLDSGGAFTRFAVLQEAQPEYPTLRPHHLAIGLYSRNADGTLVRTQRIELDVAGPRTDVPELVGLRQPDLIMLNDDDLTYALTRFDDQSLATLSTSIGQVADPLARTLCWSAVLNMALQAEISPATLVTIVAAGMGGETSVSVLQGVLSLVREVLSAVPEPAWLPAGLDQLASEASRLLRAAVPGSDHQLAWAQLLAWTATTSAQLDLVADILDGTVDVPGLVVDTELRWSLLLRLAATGRAGDAEIDAELAGDTTDAGRVHAMACRAAIGDATHKETAWHLLTGPSDFSIDTAVEVGRAFNHLLHAGLLAPYADKYFEVLPRIWAAREGSLAIALAASLFPYPAASPGLLARIDDFLASGEHDPGLIRVVREGRDIVEKALRARQAPSMTQIS
jgi:aminopeptidase N